MSDDTKRDPLMPTGPLIVVDADDNIVGVDDMQGLQFIRHTRRAGS